MPKTKKINVNYSDLLKAVKANKIAIIDDYTDNQDAINYFYLCALEFNDAFVIKFLKKNKLVWEETEETSNQIKLLSEKRINTIFKNSVMCQLNDITKYFLANRMSWQTYASILLADAKSKLQSVPASEMIGLPLSPYHAFMGQTLLQSAPDEPAEVYHRSEFSPLKKIETIDPNPHYESKNLTNGEKAHVGVYKNSFQRLGDKLKSAEFVTLETTPGMGDLYDLFLKHKNNTCKYIIEKIRDFKFIKVGHYNGYPCLMIHIKKNTIHNLESGKTSEAAFAGWVNLLISFFVGLINYRAYESGVPIELVRRSSFGFIFPTIAPTDESIRINVGIIPNEYADIIATCLDELDKMLESIAAAEDLPQVPKNSFYNSKSFLDYLPIKYKASKSKTHQLDDVVQLLWQQVEKCGKTTLQNVMRTSRARDGIAAIVFNSLKSNKADTKQAFCAGVMWVINQLEVKNDHLSFVSGSSVEYANQFNDEPSYTADHDFIEVLERFLNNVSDLYGNDPLFAITLENLRESVDNMDLNGLYIKIELLNELIKISVIKSTSEDEFKSTEDGYGSDSESEMQVDEAIMYHRKIIVSNGMRAIWAALKACELVLNKEFNIYLDDSYYEVDLGRRVIAQLESLRVDVTKSRPEAKVLLYDLNACITRGKQNKSLNNADIDQKNKILILDTTSATNSAIRSHIEKFAKSRAPVLFLVASALKNEQGSADANSYGSIRIITKNRTRLITLYKAIKKNEPPVASSVAHEYRRTMKKIGNTQVAGAFFHTESAIADETKLNPLLKPKK